MDIKNVMKGVVPLQPKAIDKIEKSIRSDSTTDRDGNGQMPFGGQPGQEQQGSMSEEQLKKCVEHLEALPSVKEHNWKVEIAKIEGRVFALLKDASGKVLRRIPEAELWSLQMPSPDEKGQILRKTA